MSGLTRAAMRRAAAVIVAALVLFGAALCATIYFCATTDTLPQTLFPDSLVKRPWDLYPMVIYAVSGLFIYPLFSGKTNSYFAQALWLSVVPDVATQMHMAFGSTYLFDNHFFIGHFLKIVAYLVPCIGLFMDYVASYERVDELQAALSRRANELARSNEDLEKFAYIASHDLKAPLRGIAQLASWIEEDIDDPPATKAHIEKMRGRVDRLHRLLDDLLAYSRVGRGDEAIRRIESAGLFAELFQLCHPDGRFELELGENLPVFDAISAPFELVFRNLIDNAIKHHDRDSGTIRIDCRDAGDCFEFAVSDDGPGIPLEHHECVFMLFQTQRPRETVEGSGIGMSLVKKTVESYGGDIHLHSEAGKGACFAVRWPKTPADDERASAELLVATSGAAHRAAGHRGPE